MGNSMTVRACVRPGLEVGVASVTPLADRDTLRRAAAREACEGGFADRKESSLGRRRRPSG